MTSRSTVAPGHKAAVVGACPRRQPLRTLSSATIVTTLVAASALVPGIYAVEASLNTRGIHPDKLSLYKKSTTQFNCIDKSGTISITAVNDDYCDCLDGSDEPGTSACTNTSFYCTNIGHIGQSLPSSRVNDGVCDPECCDGSEEFSGLVSCPNTCNLVAAEHKKKLDADIALKKEGSKKRQMLISLAKDMKLQRESQVTHLKSTLKVAAQRISTLKDLKAEAETYQAHMQEVASRKSKNTCEEKLLKSISIEKEIRDAAVLVHKKHTALVSSLKELEAVSDEIGSDDREKAIEEVMHALVDHEQIDADTLTLLYPPTAPDEPEDEIIVPQKLADPCNEDHAPFVVCVVYSIYYASLSVWRGALSPIYWDGWTKLYNSAVDMAYNDVVYKDPKHTGELLLAAERDQDNAQKMLNDLVVLDTVDMGPDREWEGLYKQCFKFVDAEYTYEVCPMESVKQIPKNGGDEVQLGEFTRWGRRGVDSTSNHNYMSMMFENGQACWNGPLRSVELVLECGKEFRILSVNEPSKCEYAMEGTSPTLCHYDDAVDDGSADEKSEL
ncbi:hypothetical protein BASA50_007257 [Batrachochytrium salamandrivorans]|uniref:Glucosidase 2 subunit beta n=1 Tax=Batrachochytrium salamandrivorans TaxID=1357716 RepID=A0ABQ8F7G2_9FUNG|nr:hypothetical protein BASA50_007257 [Batrachochytrium salamandrivorans]KAJ1340880.1 hypothetical protein BSLG_004357 [Batrachochytrium salamandrivorans]